MKQEKKEILFLSKIISQNYTQSVLVIPIAQPMSAAFNAGASFTPSPVIATTWTNDCHALTILILFSGDTLA